MTPLQSFGVEVTAVTSCSVDPTTVKPPMLFPFLGLASRPLVYQTNRMFDHSPDRTRVEAGAAKYSGTAFHADPASPCLTFERPTCPVGRTCSPPSPRNTCCSACAPLTLPPRPCSPDPDPSKLTRLGGGKGYCRRAPRVSGPPPGFGESDAFIYRRFFTPPSPGASATRVSGASNLRSWNLISHAPF